MFTEATVSRVKKLNKNCRILFFYTGEAGRETDLSPWLPDREWADFTHGEARHWHRCQHTCPHQQHLWAQLRQYHWRTTPAAHKPGHRAGAWISKGQCVDTDEGMMEKCDRVWFWLGSSSNWFVYFPPFTAPCDLPSRNMTVCLSQALWMLVRPKEVGNLGKCICIISHCSSARKSCPFYQEEWG